MSAKKTALAVLVGVAILGGIIALWRSGGSSDTSTADRQVNTAAGGTAATGTDAIAARITALIYKIDRIKLDASIFTSPAYVSLVDRSQPIPPEPIGRPDPFAPLYQDDIISTTTGRIQGQGGLLNQNQNSGGARVSTSTRTVR